MNERDKMEMIEHAEALREICLETKCSECPFYHETWERCLLFSEPHNWELETIEY